MAIVKLFCSLPHAVDQTGTRATENHKIYQIRMRHLGTMGQGGLVPEDGVEGAHLRLPFITSGPTDWVLFMRLASIAEQELKCDLAIKALQPHWMTEE